MGERPTYKPPPLKAWRKFRDITQEQLAEALGCSTSLISMIESGARGYDQDFLERAAKVLRTTPDQLLAINPLKPPTQNQIFDLVGRLPESEMPRLRSMLEAWAATYEHEEERAPAKPKRAAKKTARKRR